MARVAEIHRKTRETDIHLRLELDGKGICQVDTGIPFMDHMLGLVAAHGFFDLEISATGDIEVDNHHTVEDLGICLGLALKEALGEKKGIHRYGEATVPMDEALARVVLDVSNRPFLAYRAEVESPRTGSFDIHLIKEFFRAVTNNAGITMHVDLFAGEDAHHISEAVFKAFARALDCAFKLESRLSGMVPSTKGIL
ncbi:MAG: imidazoleglycerol-phosphate dehydratase HisB [Desulfatiglandaceae bacterium]|jgi:imidazoleglycerol-phosphate dehydratase